MAAHVFVVDSTARRQQIKTTPAKYLRDILQEACQKFNKDPDQFGLSDFGRPPKAFDLSLTVRLAGLPNGAKLQLVQSSRSPTVLPIALQLPETLGGGRVSDRFPSDTSLWLVLRKFEDALAGDPPKKLNITQRGIPSTDTGAGRLVYEQPVLHIMGRELGSFAELQKSLLQLGFNSGSVLLRLNYKNSGTPIEEAMKEITDYFTASTSPQPDAQPNARITAPMEGIEHTPAASGAHASAAGNMASLPDVGAESAAASTEAEAAQSPSDDTIMTPPPPSPKGERSFEDHAVVATSSETPFHADNTSDKPTESSSAPAPAQDSFATSSGPSIAVYKPSSNPTPSAALAPYNPADYEPSVEHAQSHQATLARASQNRRLASDKELATAQEARQQQLSTIKSAVIRVRLPDQMMIDLNITPTESSASLYDTVDSMLEHPGEPFQLRYTGPKGQLITLNATGSQKLIVDLGFSGRVLVTMVWDPSAGSDAREGAVLKSSMRAQAQELEVNLPDSRGSAADKADDPKGKKPELTSEKKERSQGEREAKLKKLMGFGRK